MAENNNDISQITVGATTYNIDAKKFNGKDYSAVMSEIDTTTGNEVIIIGSDLIPNIDSISSSAGMIYEDSEIENILKARWTDFKGFEPNSDRNDNYAINFSLLGYITRNSGRPYSSSQLVRVDFKKNNSQYSFLLNAVKIQNNKIFISLNTNKQYRAFRTETATGYPTTGNSITNFLKDLYYSKSEIDTKLGNIDTILDSINGEVI